MYTLLLELGPLLFALCAGQQPFEEEHAAQAVGNLGEVVHQRIRLHTGDLAADRIRKVLVIVGEGLDERLGMAGRQARAARRRRADLSDIIVAALVDVFGLTQFADIQIVRVLLVPLDTAGFAVDPDGEVVLSPTLIWLAWSTPLRPC